MIVKFTIFIFVHIIGAIATIVYFKRMGAMKDAKLHGDDVRYCTPATIIFMNIIMWEIIVLAILSSNLNDYVNNLDW